MAAPGAQSFGTRQFPPSPFTPLPPENPVWAFVEPWLETFKTEAEHIRSVTDAAIARLRAELSKPRLTKTVAQKRPVILPILRSVGREGREVGVRFLAYTAGIGALAFVAAQLFETPTIAAAIEPVSRPDWVVVGKPYPAFLLTLPDLGQDGRYSIVRHADGGGRKDIMTFGEPGRSLRYAMIEIYRPGKELDTFSDTASEIAERAGNLGPAGAIKAALPINSKFGPAKAVEFSVGNFGIGHCIGAVRAFEQPRMQISGLFCSMNTLVDRNDVACALDRLTLMSAGSDPDIAKLFADAELKRTFCGQRDPLLAATPKRSFGPQAVTAPKLRGRFASR